MAAVSEIKWRRLMRMSGGSDENTHNLHGNRNSALACWFVDDQSVIRTETFLANAEVMAAAATKPHYHEEKAATRHEPPAG